MTLLLRLISMLVGALELGLFYWQVAHPSTYPVPLIIGMLAFPLAAAAIAWRRVSFVDLLEKMAPSFIVLLSLAFALVLAEGPWAIGLIVVLAGLTAFLSLELLFLLAYDPHRYPVNGLSHINIAFVPIAAWCIAATSSGLIIFLHTNRVWHVVTLAVLGAVLFRTTAHPMANREQHWIWTLVGVVVGAQAGLIGILLPLSMPMQGILASVFIAGCLRARRYVYEPKPPLRQAWSEGVGILVLLVVVLVTAKWI